MDEQRRRGLLFAYRERVAQFDEIARRRGARQMNRPLQPAVREGCAVELLAVSADKAAKIGLTPRELEVLVLVARGASNQQVARKLGIAIETVKSHVKNMLAALGASTRAQCVTIGFCNGVLRPNPD
jgi:DNA-binding CsgD family transcriptional regulator